jgi:drug/metabolite transporter (DMT)-like permease
MKKTFLELHFIIIILSLTAILGKLTEASTLTLVFYRTLIAASVLFAIVYFGKQNYKIPLASKLKLLGIGLVLGLHWLCFFGAAKLSTVSISLVTFATVSVFTSFLKPLLIGEKIAQSEIFLGLGAVGAVALIFGFEPNYFWGTAIGLLSGLFAAVFSLFNSKLTYEFESRVISFYEISGACMTMLVGILFCQPKTGFLILGWDWLWIGILALVCTVYPHVKMIELLKKIDVFTANLSLNLEPVYGIIMAFFVFGESEKMSIPFYIGAIILLSLVAIDAYLKSQTKVKA